MWLRVQAPFAAYRGFQAGVYRTTMPIMPPSAALGLVLNLAGIEMRTGLEQPTTQIRADIPHLQLAIGAVDGSNCEVCTLYQQLHSYPVGNSGKDTLKPLAKGAKFWITPVRREVLVGLDVIIGIQEFENLFDRISQALRGEFNVQRYGLPFAGDNNFLFDRIDIIDSPPLTHWYEKMEIDSAPRNRSQRLTVGIDRLDNSKTTSYLFAPIAEPSIEPPGSAWTWTPKRPSQI
ncbi:MAG: type I-MYXAN CRISPR-associated protein Cas5/Cmx5/DevS [Oscillatoriales cyanobacterium SM2_2_1]|nr:type I-MYXAN CRISPR-associated protein Cas5/Cmx5/DevS [Oscillatoriales cyanobacterium SM2_2_1]